MIENKIKKLLVILTLAWGGLSLFAQNLGAKAQNNGRQAQNPQPAEEEIELPDVTTVINGKTFTAGKDSVPDYTEILPEESSPKVQLPEMEEVKTSSELPESQKENAQKEKDIYAEGQLGAGYPFYFTGDFSIYRASGNSPFQIDFSHEGAEGFARKLAEEGYFARSTSVYGKKSFFGQYGNHRISAGYKMTDDGLQLNSDSYSDMVKHTISADAGSDWTTDKGLLISYGCDGAWFNRYGQVMKNSVTYDDFRDSTKVLDLNPYMGFGWQGSGFQTMFKVFYGLQANLADSDNLLKAEHSWNSDYSYRGQFQLSASWKNDFVKAYGDGSLIIGTASGTKEITPAFTLGADFTLESFTEGRFITINAKGGIDSYQEKIRNLENKYHFAILPSIPTETSDWFAQLDLNIPIMQEFEVKGGIEFRKTCFDNGLWTVDYDDKNLMGTTGLYVISQDDRTEFNSNLGFFAEFERIKAGIKWKSFWIDRPALEEAQKISLSMEYQSLNAKWNAGTAANLAFGSGSDSCPDFSAWAGIRLAPALSLAFELNDVIKLFGGWSRDYAHSQYIKTSGNAVLKAKFQF